MLELASPGLTVGGCVNDQKLLLLQGGHSVSHLGHLHMQGKGTELAGLSAAGEGFVPDP